MSFGVGSLVRARGREWVVLPDSDDDLLVLRPLGGTDDEIAGIWTPLEAVAPARFALPDPNLVGDHRSCSLLRDALRLGFRSGAGPFRSLARITVEPRPYQLVPLLMALRLDPVRLLIADDVGIGKTVEAGLVARELLDQGDATRLAVLCPPHLAQQWQGELAEKFQIDAEVVLPSTATRLERRCALNQSLFDVYPHVVVSVDFIKSDRRRDEFLRTCPELVIVDEAHTSAWGAESKGRHQRHDLVAGLASDPQRHLILVTATPHSGKEAAFRSLVEFLDPAFSDLPTDPTADDRKRLRGRLAQHMVQRRRADIRHYLDTDTAFPRRFERDETYRLETGYRKFFTRVLDYARETVAHEDDGSHRQRVRWWSALALLRALGSSPAAAAATLRNRASAADTATADEADEAGRRSVLDLADDETVEALDVTPGADPGADGAADAGESSERRRLLDMARAAEALRGKPDAKLTGAIDLVRSLLADGCNPIVFCRFIDTADYVADALRAALKDVAVDGVTGRLPAEERAARVATLGAADHRILVATDCLSEGINLQDRFDAVVHYDLSWNPTRHEQREGRVDRFGQPAPEVRIITYYGENNPVDGIILEVLIRKHRTIRSELGVSVPVPVDTDSVVEAILEGTILHSSGDQLTLFEEGVGRRDSLHREWDDAADREKRSRTVYAQRAIKADEVAQIVADVRASIGSPTDVAAFVPAAITAAHGTAAGADPTDLDLTESPLSLRDLLPLTTLRARFDLPVADGETHLHRTHPVVAALATWLLDTSLDALADSPARRAGAIRTDVVRTRTTLLLVRHRFHVDVTRGGVDKRLLAEDWALLAFEGTPDAATWLPEDAAARLVDARPAGNITAEQARDFLNRVTDGFTHLGAHLEADAAARAAHLEEQYGTVRSAAGAKGLRYSVTPHLPPDVLGIYVYLPVPGPPP